MAPGGHVFKQTTLTRETIQDTLSLNELNNPTPINGRDNRGKDLEKMKKAMESKMKIEISVGKGRPTKLDQSAKLSNELGIIA
ncbi:hypothetical protein H5410_005646 [Solanum commersonii]|uniref:Uncharacterized protein n=1 Tax=Solanum commersonii TaxID=4109 RepID=A0A9J6A842_SOLCO|nr:hypothetical protein H5410_005646 [Solanum commersonii]